MLLIGQAQDPDSRITVYFQDPLLEHPPAPLPTMTRVRDPCTYNTDIGIPAVREIEHGAKIAFEIPAGNAKPRIEISMGANAPVQT